DTHLSSNYIWSGQEEARGGGGRVAMGAPKQKWTSEEEEALRAGVEKHGAGKWRTIQKDPEFSRCLSTRSNIDLKVLLLPPPKTPPPPPPLPPFPRTPPSSSVPAPFRSFRVLRFS
ncbi:hypothetical protein BHM03_00019369, partial [Ensete ventricosum]